jgi:2-keto-3-deoxy-6-phosphogluconate aldolase
MVAAVGGSWICDRKLIKEKKWDAIKNLAVEALGLAAMAQKR